MSYLGGLEAFWRQNGGGVGVHFGPVSVFQRLFWRVRPGFWPILGSPNVDFGLFLGVQTWILTHFGGSDLDFGPFWGVRPGFWLILWCPDLDFDLFWGVWTWILAFLPILGSLNLYFGLFWGLQTWILAHFGGSSLDFGLFCGVRPEFWPLLGGQAWIWPILCICGVWTWISYETFVRLGCIESHKGPV